MKKRKEAAMSALLLSTLFGFGSTQNPCTFDPAIDLSLVEAYWDGKLRDNSICCDYIKDTLWGVGTKEEYNVDYKPSDTNPSITALMYSDKELEPTNAGSGDCPPNWEPGITIAPAAAQGSPIGQCSLDYSRKTKFLLKGVKGWSGLEVRYDGDHDQSVEPLYLETPIMIVLTQKDKDTGKIYAAKPVIFYPWVETVTPTEDWAAVLTEEACSILYKETTEIPKQSDWTFDATTSASATWKLVTVATGVAADGALANSEINCPQESPGYTSTKLGTYSVEVRKFNDATWTLLTTTSACLQFDDSTLEITAVSDAACPQTVYEYRLKLQIPDHDPDPATACTTGTKLESSDNGSSWIVYDNCQLIWDSTPIFHSVTLAADTQIFASCTDCEYSFGFSETDTSEEVLTSGPSPTNTACPAIEKTLSAEDSNGNSLTFVTLDPTAETFTFNLGAGDLPLAVNPMDVVLTATIKYAGSIATQTEFLTVELIVDCITPIPITTPFVVFANTQTSVTQQYQDLSADPCNTDAQKFVWQADGSNLPSEFSDNGTGQLTFTTPTVSPGAFAFQIADIEQRVGTIGIETFPFIYCYIYLDPSGQKYLDPTRVDADNYFIVETPTADFKIPLTFPSYTVSSHCGDTVFSTSGTDTTLIADTASSSLELEILNPTTQTAGVHSVTVSSGFDGQSTQPLTMTIPYEIVRCAEEPLTQIIEAFEELVKLPTKAKFCEADVAFEEPTFTSFTLEVDAEFVTTLSHPLCLIDHFIHSCTDPKGRVYSVRWTQAADTTWSMAMERDDAGNLCSGFDFATQNKIEVRAEHFTGNLSRWYGTFTFDVVYGMGTHTFANKMTYDLIVLEPCYVKELIFPGQVSEDVVVELDQEVTFTFSSFRQEPDCELEIFYNVTLLETDYLDKEHPNFFIEAEGIAPEEPLIYFEDRSLRIAPQNSSLAGRAWSIYVSGKVNETDVIWTTAAPFKLQVPPIVYELKNEPPSINDRITDLAVHATIDHDYFIGYGMDHQMDPYYLSELSYQGLGKAEYPTWITFNNSTDVNLDQGLFFRINPPLEAIGMNVKMLYTLQDRNEQNPKSAEFSLNIYVLSLNKTFEKEVREERKEQKIIFVEIEQPDRYTFFHIRFSEPIQVLSNCTKWNNTNEGGEKLVIDYIKSPETQTLLYDEDLEIKMWWTVVYVSVKDDDDFGVEHRQGVPFRGLQGVDSESPQGETGKNDGSLGLDGNEDGSSEVSLADQPLNAEDITMIKTDWIQIHVEFDYPEKVSRKIDDTDKLSIKVAEMMFDLEMDVQEITFIQQNPISYQKTYQIERIYEPKMIQRKEELTEAVETTLMAFFGANFLLNLLLGGLLQMLWGMINTLQLVVLTVLFNMEIPINALEFMVMILKLLGLEFVSTEDLMNGILQLRDAEAFYTKESEEGILYSRWEDVGYDSIYFVILIGAIFFGVLFFLLCTCLRGCTIWLTRSCDDNFLTRQVRKHVDYTVITVRFIFEGCIELGLAAMINMLMVSTPILCSVLTPLFVSQLSKSTWKHSGEIFSFVAATLCLLALFMAPFFYVRRSRAYLAEVQEEDADPDEVRKRKEHLLFADYKPNRESMKYGVLFMLRRLGMILTLTVMPGLKYAQVYTHMASTMYFIVFMIKVKPYLSSFVNKMEVINDITVLLATYPLLLFTPWIGELSRKIEMGWFLVGIICTSIVFNITCIGFKACLEIRFKFRVWYKGYYIRKMRMAEYLKRKEALEKSKALALEPKSSSLGKDEGKTETTKNATTVEAKVRRRGSSLGKTTEQPNQLIQVIPKGKKSKPIYMDGVLIMDQLVSISVSNQDIDQDQSHSQGKAQQLDMRFSKKVDQKSDKKGKKPSLISAKFESKDRHSVEQKMAIYPDQRHVSGQQKLEAALRSKGIQPMAQSVSMPAGQGEYDSTQLVQADLRDNHIPSSNLHKSGQQQRDKNAKKQRRGYQVKTQSKPTLVYNNPLIPDPTTGQIDFQGLNRLYEAQNELGMTFQQKFDMGVRLVQNFNAAQAELAEERKEF